MRAEHASDTTGRGTARLLSTPRLVLTPIAWSDVEALRAHWDAPPVRRHLWDDRPVTRAAVEELVSASEGSFRSAGYGMWAIRPLHNRSDRPGGLVGACGLREVAGCLCRSPGTPGSDVRLVEIVYSVAPDVWGRGVGHEAAVAVLAYAFGQLVLPEVVGGADVDNPASLRLLHRLGMRPLGELTTDGSAYPYLVLPHAEWVRRPAS